VDYVFFFVFVVDRVPYQQQKQKTTNDDKTNTQKHETTQQVKINKENKQK